MAVSLAMRVTVAFDVYGADLEALRDDALMILDTFGSGTDWQVTVDVVPHADPGPQAWRGHVTAWNR